MNTLTTIIQEHFPESKEIPKQSIRFSKQIRKMCEQNVCGSYGKFWVCPPAVAPLAELIETITGYERCRVVYRLYDIESSYDFKGMMAGMTDFRDRLIKMKNYFPNGIESLVLGAGSCNLCKKCTYPEGEPCQRPEDALVSLEASGIDVVRLMSENGMKYNNGANTVTYIGAVMFNSVPLIQNFTNLV
ncbi:MAG: DUF2284 domain-containing protein [Deltaproteobacteria bacterium]|nr:DUF2284 domain-containing protein [Deltaproteobacteria bacterium]